MAEFLTYSDVDQFNKENFSRTLIEKAQKQSVYQSTFLSHSSRDASLLPTIIGILENHGATVYIDKKDPALPPTTSPKTADILRNRIKQCKNFVLLVTKNSESSTWIPWELGLADALKSTDRVALFPVAEESYDQRWARREYLGLYERIVWSKFNNANKSEWIVLDENQNSGTRLGRWIKR